MTSQMSRTPEQRLAALDKWERHLDHCYEGNVQHPIFVALQEVIINKNIPKQLFAALLTAFRMDVSIHRYQTFSDLLGYCRHSANPIGRLVLAVFDDLDEQHFNLPDNICTALQLTNFWQDVSLDRLKDRLYIPLEDMNRFGYTEKICLRFITNELFVE